MVKLHSPNDVMPALSLQPVNFAAEDPGVGGWRCLMAQGQGADRAGIDRLVVSDHVILCEKLSRQPRASRRTRSIAGEMVREQRLDQPARVVRSPHGS